MKETGTVPTIYSGDLVRVVRQSATVNHWIPMTGKVGFVGEIRTFGREVVLEFNEIDIEGRGQASGGVPASCVERLDPETDAAWFAAKARYDENLDRLLEESRERGRREDEAHERALAAACAATTTPRAQVEAVVAAYEKVRRQARRDLGLE